MGYKYAVVKIADIDNLLNEEDRQKMYRLLNDINGKRELAGKKLNSYIVVNSDEPYARDVIRILKEYGHWGPEENIPIERIGISDLVKEAHQIAVDKGWYEEPVSFVESLALAHSELSEALEEHRNGWGFRESYYEDGKPCGIPIELADTVIRIFDMCGHLGIDLEQAINEKMMYNASRPHRHGGKRL